MNKFRVLVFSIIALSLAQFACQDSKNQNQTANTNAAQAEGTPGMPAEELASVRAMAEEDLRRYPNDPNAHFTLGEVFLHERKFAEAVEKFKFVIAADPNDAQAHIKLSEAYAGLGQGEEAARHREEALRLRPSALADELFQDGKVEEALEEYRKAADANANNAEVYNRMGEAYLMLGRNSEAAEAYRRLIQLNPKYTDAYFNLGNAYDRIGMYKEAAEAFNQAVRLNSKDADAYFNLGNAYGNMNRHANAIEAYRQALRLDPNAADVRKNLGLSYLKNGNRAAAMEQYEVLKALNAASADVLLREINGTTGQANR